jgi:hypothetical protein
MVNKGNVWWKKGEKKKAPLAMTGAMSFILSRSATSVRHAYPQKHNTIS